MFQKFIKNTQSPYEKYTLNNNNHRIRVFNISFYCVFRILKTVTLTYVFRSRIFSCLLLDLCVAQVDGLVYTIILIFISKHLFVC